MWANYPDPADRQIRIDGGIDQYLDVFFVSEIDREIHPTLVGMVIPNHAIDVFAEVGIFRFDIAVAGDGNARAQLSLRVSTGDVWNDLEVEPLA